MRQIEIEWVSVGLKVTATLMPKKNPELCDLLWENLPYNSLQNHALVSGDHLYHLAPISKLVHTQAQTREDRTQSPDGTVFLSHLQHLAVKYGVLTEKISAAAVGEVIPEDIPILKRAGQEIWKACYETKQVVEARVTRKGESATSFVLPKPPKAAGPVDQLIRDIHAETERTWVTAPPEVVDLHAGRIKSGAGSRGQWFSTLVFLNGEARPLGYGAFGGLVKSCFNNDVSLEVLKQITPNFIKTPAEFLAYCGLETLWDFVQRTVAVLKDVESKEDYYTLMSALGLYGNSLNAWNLHYFPWRHGDEYLYEKSRPAETAKTT